ncbi:hypothetical protein HD600_000321 [Microbacterium ginsengiterrae]|uniref:DUF4166 domain-containing protein n=1 Tax=Microbacterium ginsengiterrae TaxID=546115 RepID=A0A7W9FC52_9MICO|nr:DUF4166 domain-containing protein [Microbacterium paludicola]MBB5741824.1 hypothetical protein [Microbacterium ginsengiterrae]
MTARRSVFLAALGAHADSLAPEVREYVAGPPEGMIGVGTGVFEIAGSPWRWMLHLARPLVGPGLLVPRREHDVPFELVERATIGANGARALVATRTFRFRGGEERFDDVLHIGREPGTLVNTVGDLGRIEVLLDVTVTTQGALRLTTRASRVRLLGRVIRLPRLLGIDGVVENGYDPVHERRTIAAVMRSPLFGTVMEYRGWFRYEPRAEPDRPSGQKE